MNYLPSPPRRRRSVLFSSWMWTATGGRTKSRRRFKSLVSGNVSQSRCPLSPSAQKVGGIRVALWVREKGNNLLSLTYFITLLGTEDIQRLA